MDFEQPEQRTDASWSHTAEPSALVTELGAIGELEDVAPTPRRGRGALWATAVVVLVVVAATAVIVGTGSSTKSAAVVLREAQGRTTGKGTAHMVADMTFTVDGDTRHPFTIEADSNFATKAVHMTFRSAAGADYYEMRVVNETAYISSALVDLPGGTHWVAITPADLTLDKNAGATAGSSDPSSGLKYLSGFTGIPRVVDHDPLDGVKVTHYAFDLNLKPILDQTGRATSALGVGSIENGLAALGNLVDLTKVPGEAWIDGNGRVRKFEYSIAVSAEGQNVKVVADLSFSHFDEPVAIEAPAPSDTVPFAKARDFFSRLMKAGSANAA
jgi:hypothetical protein